jgi:hypothetical protein
MFPIAHAWLVERLVAEPQPAHYLGCIWPDMLFESPLTHPQSHRSGMTLARHALAHPADVAFHDFVVGVLTHGSEPRGFDWYSDEQYRAPLEARGYAFQRGQPLASAAAAACGLAEDQGWWKAHNLVEMAFELTLFAERPACGDHLAAACAETALAEHVAASLAQVFGVPAAALAHAMRRFPDVVAFRPAHVEMLAAVYAAQVRHKHPESSPDTAAIAGLIERAHERIAPDYHTFLADSALAVDAMLHETLP